MTINHDLKPGSDESLDELLIWYGLVFIPQLVNGSNCDPKLMERNSAVVVDAVDSYRTWRKLERIKGPVTGPGMMAHKHSCMLPDPHDVPCRCRCGAIEPSGAAYGQWVMDGSKLPGYQEVRAAIEESVFADPPKSALGPLMAAWRFLRSEPLLIVVLLGGAWNVWQWWEVLQKLNGLTPK